MAPRPARTRVRPSAYAIIFAVAATLLFVLHAQWITLPYYWDEVGYYIPASLDIYHFGALIPRSVPPIVHPPAVMAYLAAVWRIAGFHPASTRVAMLLIASIGLTASFLLAIELCKNARGFPAIVAAVLLCLSPLFVSQSVLAQLDMPAMTLTALALLFFLQNRLPAAAIACATLVLVKETGVFVPLLFAAWLLREKRWRDAAWFIPALVALGVWGLSLLLRTGHWLGTPGFADYNLSYPLNPARFAANLARRIYYLGFANCHWAGMAAIVLAWRSSRLFQERSWKIALWLLVGHSLLVTMLGGATLERYLLPVLPILYAAMAAALSLLPRAPRVGLTVVLVAGVAAANFVNPPYPFPYEDNVSFATFAQTQRDAAEVLDIWYPGAQVTTAWPLSGALIRPELGFVRSAYPPPRELPDFSTATLSRLDWSHVQVLAVFSRDWDPHLSLIRLPGVDAFWRRFFGYAPQASPAEAKSVIPFPLAQEIRRGSQWVDIYVNPGAVFGRPRFAFSRPPVDRR